MPRMTGVYFIKFYADRIRVSNRESTTKEAIQIGYEWPLLLYQSTRKMYRYLPQFMLVSRLN